MSDALFEMDTQHPMFTYRCDPLLQRHRDAARQALASELRRFDEKALTDNRHKDHDIVAWCRHVWELTEVANATEQTTGAAWLVGVITIQRIRTVEKLRKRRTAITESVQPMTRTNRANTHSNITRSINVITDLNERLVQAITKGA